LFEREGGDAAEDQSGDEERERARYEWNEAVQFCFSALESVRCGQLIDWWPDLQEVGSPGLLPKAGCCLEEKPC
jgi:hypothetical protein